jgi:FAD/FMN-containing dehydrogenase
MPVKGGIVLDMTKMDKILDVNLDDETVTVQPGLIYMNLLDELEKKGYTLFTYPSSAPASTIGGWLCTSGLGIGSLKHGQVRNQIVFLEVVTPKGEIINFTKEAPRKREYTLFWFLSGEGTIAIITKVKLRMRRKPEVSTPHAVCFQNIESFYPVVNQLIKSKNIPFSIEYFDKEYLDIKRSTGHFAPEAGVYAIICFDGTQDEVDQSNEFFKNIIQKANGLELNKKTAESEWDGDNYYPERFYSFRIGAAGPTLLAGDMYVPINELPDSISEICRIKDHYNIRLGLYGNIVAKNASFIFPLIVVNERDRSRFLSVYSMMGDLTELSLEKGGSPIGAGLWNVIYLDKFQHDVLFQKMKDLKKEIDPDNILNPGKLFEIQTKYGFTMPSEVFKSFYRFLKRISCKTR